MEISDFKRINKGALKASFNIFIPEWGMTIRNCNYFDTSDKNWIGFPSRQYIDPDTNQKKYFSYIIFEDEVKKRLDSAAKKELEKFLRDKNHDREVTFI